MSFKKQSAYRAAAFVWLAGTGLLSSRVNAQGNIDAGFNASAQIDASLAGNVLSFRSHAVRPVFDSGGIGAKPNILKSVVINDPYPKVSPAPPSNDQQTAGSDAPSANDAPAVEPESSDSK